MNEYKDFISNYKREILFLSSGKAKEFADKVRQQLSDRIQNDSFLQNDFVCLAWDNRRFLKKSYTTFDSILKYAQWLHLSGGYAICVLYPDDLLKKNADSNSAPYYVPRDNVIFELGLFYGALGQDNTFFLFCDSANSITVHNPTDLDGVGDYRYSWDNNTDAPEKGAESKLAEDLFNTIKDAVIKNMIVDTTKESGFAETAAKDKQQLQLGIFNEYLEENNPEEKLQNPANESAEMDSTISTSNKEEIKNYYPKPLTRGIDPN